MIERDDYAKNGIPYTPWLDAWHTIWEATDGKGTSEKPLEIKAEDRDGFITDLTTHLTTWNRRDCLVGQDVDYFRAACPWESRVIDALYPNPEEATDFITSFIKYTESEILV